MKLPARIVGRSCLVLVVTAVAACAAPPPRTSRSTRAAAPPTSPPAVASAAPRGTSAADRARAQALVLEGKQKLAADDAVGAVKLHEQALALDPSLGEANLEWAIAAERAGTEQTLVAVRYARAAELSPENPRAHFLLAAWRESHGDKERAVASYVRAAELDPTHKDALTRAAALDLEAGRADTAKQRFESALRIDRAHVPALLGLADAAERTRDLVLAEETQLALVRQAPRMAMWRSRLIAFYKRTGQDKKARDAEGELERLDPRDERKLRSLRRTGR
jgi:tetratricopeptide (TPR) repeat protein